ncbi:unnamed protein product [Ambrosiozyma monospora]|uniref:Unnamed protein product n=1 Tax=Ambrosiozyma monospora TaxID=43982 RepID=A0A9W6YT07_AMBMO|nr:unnamed protein product [Ambrosiozyma monospora]
MTTTNSKMQSTSFIQFSKFKSNSVEYQSDNSFATEVGIGFTKNVSLSSEDESDSFKDYLNDVRTLNEFTTENEFLFDFCVDDLTEAVDENAEGNGSASELFGSCSAVHHSYNFPTCLSPIIEEPESSDYFDSNAADESISSCDECSTDCDDSLFDHVELENKYVENKPAKEGDLQNIYQLASATASFHFESYIPRPSCVSSTVAPVPKITPIFGTFIKKSTENVQQSLSDLDFCPAGSETKTIRKGKQFWNHVCQWFYGQGDSSIATSEDDYSEEQSITSSNDPDSITLANSTLTPANSNSRDISESNKSCSSSSSATLSSKYVPSKRYFIKTVYASRLPPTNECELLYRQAHRKCQSDRLGKRLSRGWKAMKASCGLCK